MLISPEYASLNEQLHHSNPLYGTSGKQWAQKVADLARQVGAPHILDYGCGKQTLAAALPDFKVVGYDPAVPGLDSPPAPADLVVCTDVLEHVEPQFIDEVLDDLCRVTSKVAFVTVATRPAVKTLADGRNAHLTVQPLAWWKSSFECRFDIVEVNEIEGAEFSLVLKALHADVTLEPPSRVAVETARHLPAAKPQAAKGGPVGAEAGEKMVMKYKGARIVFNTPNGMTRWRVQSILEKEPDTIRWIEAMDEGSVLIDVGANVGMYTLLAAATRKCKVFAFEPESQNYALLNANLAANDLAGQVLAFPLALSDSMQLDKLYLSDFSSGGSCHSFAEEVGFDLKPRRAAFTQGAFSVTLDQLVDSGAVPVPDYIKLDVDGIEHKVLCGARKTLANPKVKQLLVELNTHLPEHTAIIDELRAAGFTYDAQQVKGALRKGGAFEGVGEFIFRRSTVAEVVDFEKRYRVAPPSQARGRAVLQHVLERVAQAPVIEQPFPYLVVDDVFPPDYYAEMLANFPTRESLRPINETGRVAEDLYKERLVVLFTESEFVRMTASQQRFWHEFASWMYTDQFVNFFLYKFQRHLEPRIDRIVRSEGALHVKGDALLVNDCTDYAIGPHTDAPHRLVSFLFYLPRDDSMRELGTTVYEPRDPGFTCWGGPHHPYEEFMPVKTVEFLPNRLMAFPKTERSFHGVAPIKRPNVNRPLLINNIRLLNQVTH